MIAQCTHGIPHTVVALGPSQLQAPPPSGCERLLQERDYLTLGVPRGQRIRVSYTHVLLSCCRLFFSCFNFVPFCSLKLVRVENLPFDSPKNLLTVELSIHHGSEMIHSARTTEFKTQDSFTITWNEDVTFIIPFKDLPKVSNTA